VLAGQPAGFPGDEHGPPFGGGTCLQRVEGMGQLADQDPGPAQVVAGVVVGLPAGQTDFQRDAAADLPGR